MSSLRDHCLGAKSKGEPLPHLQLGGPSGVGKTHLAKSIAAEMQTDCIEHYASRQSKKWQISELLATVKKGDVVFIDEVHALPVDVQELLYPAIDLLQVPEVDAEKHRIVENKSIKIPPFTLVVATDQPGMLRNALRQRLVLRYTVGCYSLMELRQIVFGYAANLGLLLKPQAATRLAEAARGIPRRARHMLLSLHTVTQDLQLEITKVMVDKHLASLGVDHDNLNKDDRRYLTVLRQRGGYMSLPNLALQLGMDVMAVQRDVEAYLIHREWVGIDSRGRFLTPTGRTFVAERRL